VHTMSPARPAPWALAFILLLALGCSDSSNQTTSGTDDVEPTLKNQATFPVGNVIYLEDDDRFTDYQSRYADVLDIVATEFDYVGQDASFRIGHTHPTPSSSEYESLDAFVEWANAQGYRVHGHNLLFYSDIGGLSWVADYREDGTWTQAQWQDWFEQYIREKVGRYRGRVASWDVLNEPLARALLDDPDARNIFVELAGPDIYSLAFQWAREADPEAKLVLNEFFLGPGAAEKTDDLIELADQIGRDGGRVDVIGFEGIYFFSPLIYTSYSYNHERFKKAADAGYMVTLSELNVALNTFPAAGENQNQTRLLHSMQRKAYNNIISAYMDAVPEEQRWGVVTWGVPDYYGFARFGSIFKTLRASGGGSEWPLLWNDELAKKPAYYGFINALNGIEEPFLYGDVYDEGDLVDDEALVQDFRAALLDQLEKERLALEGLGFSSDDLTRYYNEVKREIEASPD
jgi:endo-1,4-beta-xylanase